MKTVADEKLEKVFGDYVHQNNGSHLTRGVKDDHVWQIFYNEILLHTATHYDVPKGKVGKIYLIVLVDKFERCQQRLHNSERILLFVSIILQSTNKVRRSGDVQRWIN